MGSLGGHKDQADTAVTLWDWKIEGTNLAEQAKASLVGSIRALEL